MSRSLKELFSNHFILLGILLAVYSYGAVMSFLTPTISPAGLFVAIEGKHTLVMLAFTAIVYHALTGSYLLYKGKKYYSSQNLSENIPVIWGAAFLAYIVTYIGIIGKATNFVTMNPESFFFFRSFMILWAAGIAYGLIRMRTESKKLRSIIPVTIILTGLAWFFWGLIVRKSIEYTMYGFTSFIWIPLTFAFGYFFWAYSGGSGHSGMKWISVGMVFMGITYLFWAPTHKSYLYEIAFFQYNISVSIILLGMTKLPWKEMSEVSTPLDLIFEDREKKSV